jgi:hypothetical protein
VCQKWSWFHKASSVETNCDDGPRDVVLVNASVINGQLHPGMSPGFCVAWNLVILPWKISHGASSVHHANSLPMALCVCVDIWNSIRHHHLTRSRIPVHFTRRASEYHVGIRRISYQYRLSIMQISIEKRML